MERRHAENRDGGGPRKRAGAVPGWTKALFLLSSGALAAVLYWLLLGQG